MNEIGRWLDQIGLGQYTKLFADNAIDVDVLPELTDEHLKDLGLPLGHRLKLLKAVAALSRGAAEPEAVGPQPTRAEAERRQLTVMFCDLVGSTALSQRLDPEDLGALIERYQTACAEVVEQFDGHVVKYLGDGILACFGHPHAHEDDAERAVRAGLGVIAAVGGLGARDGISLEVRVGIATGRVVVGDLTGQGRDGDIVGETPNLAARLQSLAEPGTVVVAPDTHRLLGDAFDYADLGTHHLKGFSQPVRVRRVLGAKATESRFAATRAGRLTPLVGREQELALLLDAWRRAKEGEGQVVLLSGEPGIGKSRVAETLRERLAGEAHTRLGFQCSPHYTNSALHPFIDGLTRLAGIGRDDAPDVKLAKLEGLLAQVNDEAEVALLFAAMLSIPTGERYPLLNLSPQRQRQKTIEALTRWAVSLSQRRPVLLILEDAHWSDPTTLEVSDSIIAQAPTARLLVLITYRPEFQPAWHKHAHVTSLTLNRLSGQQCQAVVDRIAGGKAVPADVLAQIVGRTDGVPLFVEELTKTVLEAGILRELDDRYVLDRPLPLLAIPSTLQDSLMARLDRLASVKEVAQIGAAIGREFSYELIAAVAPLGEGLREALRQLEQAELIFRQGSPPAASYAFKHALVQDAAYMTLLRSKRRKLHARIAAAIEAHAPQTAEMEPELLAHHCTQAGFLDKAIDYWHRAAERAAQRSANLEAVNHLQKGLELVGALPEGPERFKQELRFLIALGPALMAAKGWNAPEVKAVYARARQLADYAERAAELFPVIWGLWLLSQGGPDPPATLELVSTLFGMARGQEDAGLLMEAHHAGWSTRTFFGELDAALGHVEDGVPLYRREAHGRYAVLYGSHDPALCGLSHRAMLLCLRGYPDQALVRSDETLALARSLGHAPSLAHSLWYRCDLHQLRREPAAVADAATALCTLAAEQSLPIFGAFAAMYEGWALAMRGASVEGLAKLRTGMEICNESGAFIRDASRLARLAEACGKAGRIEEGLALAADALACIERIWERWVEADVWRLKGELLLARPGPDAAQAEACFRRAIDIARRQKARLWELRAATSLARLWRQQGRHDEAHDLLAPVYNWFTEGFDTPDLKDAKALLDALQ